MKKHHYTVEEVAAREEVSPRRVRQWIDQGRIVGGVEKVGPVWIIHYKYRVIKKTTNGRPRKPEPEPVSD
jgi:hypothetical protein